MTNEEKKFFSVTFPLKTEKWQEDILEKRFRLAGNLYNELINRTRKRFLQMKQTKRYREAYLIEDKKKRNKVYRDLQKEYRLSHFDFINEMTKLYRIYCNHIDSLTAQTLAKRVWRAHEACLFRNGNAPNFKKKGSMNTLSSMTNRSGIHVRGTTLFWKGLELPIVIKDKPYELWAVSKEAVYPTIVKKSSGYYVSILFKGIPDQKNRSFGNGKVGLHIKINKLYISKEDGVDIITLPESSKNYDQEIKRLQKALERSRRAMNPSNYNADGTIKSGKSNWVFSEEYKSKKRQLARVYERKRANRRQLYTILANQIIAMGNEFYLSKPDYNSMQKKLFIDKTLQEYTIKSKNRKAIQSIAPYDFTRILGYKLAFYDIPLIEVSADEKNFAALLCNKCGSVHTEDNFAESNWICAECGEANNKDINIARNIVKIIE